MTKLNKGKGLMPQTKDYPIIAPRGGLRYDLQPDLISDMELAGGKNIFFEDGLIKKRYGYRQFGDNLPLTSAIMGCDQFIDFDANKSLLVLDTDLVYKWLPIVTAAATQAKRQWDVINVSKVEDDCETTWTSDMGDSGSVADETTIKKVGSKSQKITVNTGFGTGLIAHRDQSLGDESAYSYIRFWIRSDTDIAAGSLQFCIDDSSGCGSPTETLDLPALDKDYWKVVILAATNPGSNMNSIESLGLQVATDLSTSANVIIYIDDIQFVKKFTGTDSDFFEYAPIRDVAQDHPWWVCTNGVDNIKYYTGSGDIADLVTTDQGGGGNASLLQAKHIIAFKDYILLLHTIESSEPCPQRVRWCNTALPRDWNGGNASYTDLRGSDWIMGGVRFKSDHVVICKEKSVWTGYATGESDIFDFDEKVSGIGCVAGRTIKSLLDEVIFLGWNDVYLFNGIDVEPAGTKIQKELLASMNPSELKRAFALKIEAQKEYWLFLTTGTNTYPDEAWCYHYDLETWSRHTYNDFITMYGLYEVETTRKFNDLTGSFDSQSWRYDDRTTLQAAPTILFGDSSGYVYEYDTTVRDEDGTAIDGYFDTKAFNFTGQQRQQRIVHLYVMSKHSGLDVYYATDMDARDKEGGWTLIKSMGVSTTFNPQKLSFRVSCDTIMFRFRNSAKGGWFNFNRANIGWQPGGRL